MKYTYIKIDHEGEDYINVKIGKNDYDITGYAIQIIKCLLKKVKEFLELAEDKQKLLLNSQKRFNNFYEVFCNLGLMTHVKDENCPICNFPETVAVRNEKMELLAEYCHCGWYRIIKKVK